MSISTPTEAAGYDPPMALVKTFVHANGKSVSKHVTDSGVIGYVADEVPLEALLGLERKLMDQMSGAHAIEGADDDADARAGARNDPLS
jgi:hypothetical protein